MGLFGKKKTEDKKESKIKADEKKPVVSDVKKDVAKKDTEKKDVVKKDESVKKDKAEVKGKRDIAKSTAYKVLVKPLVTEKAASLGVLSKYIFEISEDANKIEVAKAVHDIYNIKPISINIVNMKGKNMRFGRTTGRRKNWKKAIITLPKGKTIDVYEGI